MASGEKKTKRRSHTVAKYIHELFGFRDIMIETQSVLTDMITRIESCEGKSRREEEVRTKRRNAEVRKAALEKKREQKNTSDRIKQLLHITKHLQNATKQLLAL